MVAGEIIMNSWLIFVLNGHPRWKIQKNKKTVVNFFLKKPGDSLGFLFCYNLGSTKRIRKIYLQNMHIASERSYWAKQTYPGTKSRELRLHQHFAWKAIQYELIYYDYWNNRNQHTFSIILVFSVGLFSMSFMTCFPAPTTNLYLWRCVFCFYSAQYMLIKAALRMFCLVLICFFSFFTLITYWYIIIWRCQNKQI